MRSAVILCSLLLSFNVYLLDKGIDMVLNYENSNKRKFLIEVGKVK